MADVELHEPSLDVSPTSVPTENIQDVEKAQNAAYDAQKAADEAKIAAHTEGETKAADAAQAAADAALVAADATSNAASQAAKDNLLNGDGAMMSSIISTCFSNPRYEIASTDTNGTATTEIYLFRDPSSYYKLELASPYVDVTKLNRKIPNAATLLSGSSAGGDALDWTLALSIFVLMFLMVLLICQQMGNHYVEVIFKCQRWFFNPRKYDYEGESISGVQSGSHFYFGKRSGIPISMGGRRSSDSPINDRKQETLRDVIVDEPYRDDDGNGDRGEKERRSLSLSPVLLPCTVTPQHQQQERQHGRKSSSSLELEMTSLSFTPEHQNHSHNHSGQQSGDRRKKSWRDNSALSSSGSSEDDEIVLDIPDRLWRDPDLVELHSLKSKSKVAIPVGSSSNNTTTNCGPHGNSSSFGDGSVVSAM